MRAVQAEEAKAYFLQEGFRRMLAEIWKKYAALEKAGGNAKLADLSPEECENIGGFFGWDLKPGTSVSIPLALFERELESSRFPFSTIPELHRALTGKPLLTRTETRELREASWNRVFEPARELLAGSSGTPAALAEWLERVRAGEAQGYRTLRDLYRTSEAAATEMVRQVCRAILAVSRSPWGCGLRGETVLAPRGVRLPVLAARITGDAHAFDLKQPAGRFLWYGLKYWVEREQRDAVPDPNPAKTGREAADRVEADISEADRSEAELFGEFDAQTIRAVYRAAVIWDDDLSSIVHVYVPAPHAEVEPVVYTLRQVERLGRERLSFSAVYAVENPSVFSTLLDVTACLREEEFPARIRDGEISGRVREGEFPVGDRLSDKLPVLICTSGQPSLAALRFITGCLEGSGPECPLLYSGDFDMKGIEMAKLLAEQFQGRFRPWCLDAETYARYHDAGPTMGEQDVARLANMELPWDARLGPVMAEHGRKCFQETFVDELIREWVRVLREHWKRVSR